MSNPDFYLFKQDRSTSWYRCRKCGAMEHSIPEICPVCGGNGGSAQKVPGVESILETVSSIEAQNRRIEND